MPGTSADIDVATMVWNVGWVQRAIDTETSLLYSDAVLVPFGADLRAHTYGLFPAVLVYPIARAFDALVAFNVMLLATLVLNGWLGHALFRQLGAGPAASMVAACALMLSGPSLDQFRVGRPIFAATWITCAALIAALRLLARPTLAWTLVLSLTVIAAAFTDLQMLLFTVLWLMCVAVWFFVRERDLDASRMLALATSAAIAAIPFFTILYPAFSGGLPLATPGLRRGVALLVSLVGLLRAVGVAARHWRLRTGSRGRRRHGPGARRRATAPLARGRAGPVRARPRAGAEIHGPADALRDVRLVGTARAVPHAVAVDHSRRDRPRRGDGARRRSPVLPLVVAASCVVRCRCDRRPRRVGDRPASAGHAGVSRFQRRIARSRARRSRAHSSKCRSASAPASIGSASAAKRCSSISTFTAARS